MPSTVTVTITWTTGETTTLEPAADIAAIRDAIDEADAEREDDSYRIDRIEIEPANQSVRAEITRAELNR